jgi:hypothetical protein
MFEQKKHWINSIRLALIMTALVVMMTGTAGATALPESEFAMRNQWLWLPQWDHIGAGYYVLHKLLQHQFARYV